MSSSSRAESVVWRLLTAALVMALPIAGLVVVIDQMMHDRLLDRSLETAALERTHIVQASAVGAVDGAATADAYAALQATLEADRLTVVLDTGLVVWSSQAEAIGSMVVVNDTGQGAIDGTSDAAVRPDGSLRFVVPLVDPDDATPSGVGERGLVEFTTDDVAGLADAARTDADDLRRFLAVAALVAWGVGALLLTLVSGRHWRVAARHRRLALHDGLTGLANRSQFHERLEQAVSGASRSDGKVGLVLLDLDGFKAINDTGGHAVGDRLLKRVSAKLNAATRRNEVSCRLGGDEFAVIVPNLTDRSELVALADRLHEELDLMVDFADGRSLRVTASMGLAMYPDDAHEPDELVSAADIGMYNVKATRRAKMREHLANAPERQYASQSWH